MAPVVAKCKGKRIVDLKRVTGPTFDTSELINKFTDLCSRNRYFVFTFYETGLSDLTKRLLGVVSNPQPIVSSSSATLDICRNPIGLDRKHVLMNKFKDSDDQDYRTVAHKVEEGLKLIRERNPLQRMDKELKEYYLSSNRLFIQRLCGRWFNMELCYINLLVVEETREHGNTNTHSPFSLTTRLKVDDPCEETQFRLPDIFKKQYEGGQAPSRVLIRGRAGVGKTTLCKKIVFDFIHYDLWNDLFDRIFLLPLPRLKSSDKIENIEDLFRKEYLTNIKDRKDLAGDVWTKLKDSNYHRTLFILDGLEYVSDESDTYKPILEELFQLPYLIVTARPHTTLPKWLEEKDNFHLELETIGFSQKEVKCYVQGYFTGLEPTGPDQNKPEAILSFLEKHRLMKSLMRIPILLDAVCWTWDRFDFQKAPPQTMSAIFTNIEKNPWEKDYKKLGDPVPHQTHLTFSNRYHHSAEYAEYAQKILELLAFAGMYSKVVDFDHNHLSIFWDARNSTQISHPSNPKTVFNEMLSKLSFLRSSNVSSGALASETPRNYHFIHLMFQEYFTAQHFVRKWKANEDLEFSDLATGEEIRISPAEFLKRSKYSARYDIVWRFVAGILASRGRGNGKELERFFIALDERPLDLLGIAHQRLVMNCLSETQSTFSLRSKIEGHLSKWLVFQCRSIEAMKRDLTTKEFKFQTLASEIEFPEKALGGLLRESDDLKEIGFASMKWLGHIPPQIMNNAISLLAKTKSSGLAKSLLVLLGRSSDKLSDEVLLSVASHLQSDAHQPAASALRKHTLPENIWVKIAERLESMDERFRMNAGYALGGQLMPSEILLDFVKMLANTDHNIRSTGISILRFQPNLPMEVVESIAKKINRKNRRVTSACMEALSGQSNLPEELIQSLTTMLIQEDNPANPANPANTGDTMRSTRSMILECQPSLPEEVLKRIAHKIDRKNGRVTSACIEALRGEFKLHEELIQSLTTMFVQEDHLIKPILRVLCQSSDFPYDLMNQVILTNGTKWLRYHKLASKWCHKSRLSDEALRVLATHLMSPILAIRLSVIKILDAQQGLSDDILEKMVNVLGDRDEKARKEVINALSHRSSLPEVTVHEIAAMLDEPHLTKKEAALEVLKHQSMLPTEVLNKIANCFTNHNPKIAIAAINGINHSVSRTNDKRRSLLHFPADLCSIPTNR